MIAITIGHRRSARGATMITTGKTEWDFNAEIGPRIQAALLDIAGIVSVVIERPDNRQGVAELCRTLNLMNPTHAVELHFNSFGDPAATGSEVLHHFRSTAGRQLAGAIQARIVDALELSDRGLKALSPGDRGWPYISGTNMPAVIVEPFFGSNPYDCAIVEARIDELIDAIARGIAEGIDP